MTLKQLMDRVGAVVADDSGSFITITFKLSKKEHKSISQHGPFELKTKSSFLMLCCLDCG